MNVDQCFHERDNVIPAHGSLHFNGECLPGELISDVEILQNLAITGLIELEIQRPYVIRASADTHTVDAHWPVHATEPVAPVQNPKEQQGAVSALSEVAQGVGIPDVGKPESYSPHGSLQSDAESGLAIPRFTSLSMSIFKA